jgi:DNA-binding Xre family transcriptional regulator
MRIIRMKIQEVAASKGMDARAIAKKSELDIHLVQRILSTTKPGNIKLSHLARIGYALDVDECQLFEVIQTTPSV